MECRYPIFHKLTRLPFIVVSTEVFALYADFSSANTKKTIPVRMSINTLEEIKKANPTIPIPRLSIRLWVFPLGGGVKVKLPNQMGAYGTAIRSVFTTFDRKPQHNFILNDS